MFTGIIEEVGEVVGIRKGEKSSRLKIKASKVLEGTNIGDSICTNGVCLTVTSLSSMEFEADVMAVTLRNSDLGKLAMGSKVNLERALRLDSRLGGHLVSGHVDGIGEITSMTKEDNAFMITVMPELNLLKYMIDKGSVAIDGVSLTIVQVNEAYFKVSIIPHTSQQTILLSKKVGDLVNLECDVIGKYVERMLYASTGGKHRSEKQNIDEDFLRDNGFF